jgi:CBS domain-containing protein
MSLALAIAAGESIANRDVTKRADGSGLTHVNAAYSDPDRKFITFVTIAMGPDMKAADVMVREVVTVSPDASVQDVANIMLASRISAVPVIAESGELLGVVSEGDLMRRVESDTGRRRSWWLSAFIGNQVLAAEYVKEHSRRVADVMTRKVITATPKTPLHVIADLLEKNAIKRVPIVEGGRVVGIVSRANLVQALASMGKSAVAGKQLDDDAIRDSVIARLRAEPWSRPALVNVIVHDGTVDLWGVVDSPSERKAARVAAEITPGVRNVNDNLLIRPVQSWA